MLSVERRVTAALTGLIGAVLVGGVSQAYLWRWGLDGLAGVTSSQFMWVLLTFGVSWGWAHGRVREGAAAGALTGLALIVSYYAMQWAVDGRHSAVAQFSGTGGLAWTLAAVGGGAVMGLFGALAGMSAPEHPRLKAVGLTMPAVVVGAGPSLWLLIGGAYLQTSNRLPAVAVFLLVAAVLLVVATRTCGPRACAHALALSIGLGGVALAGLWVLQTQGWLYLTF